MVAIVNKQNNMLLKVYIVLSLLLLLLEILFFSCFKFFNEHLYIYIYTFGAFGCDVMCVCMRVCVCVRESE